MHRHLTSTKYKDTWLQGALEKLTHLLLVQR